MTYQPPLCPPPRVSLPDNCAQPVQFLEIPSIDGIPPIGGNSAAPIGAPPAAPNAVNQALASLGTGGRPSATMVEPSASAGLSRRKSMSLLGLFALFAAAPTAKAVATRSPVTVTPPQQVENARLIHLGDRLAAIETALSAATARREEARAVALANWPAPPSGIVWDYQREVPHWCGVDMERDLDDRTIYANGQDRPARKVAEPYQLEVFVVGADGRTREAKAAKQALTLAREYEAARESVLASSGYAEARNAVQSLELELDGLASAIHKEQHSGAAGLAIKARAVLAVITLPNIDPDTAFRHKLLHAETLARGIVDLRAA